MTLTSPKHSISLSLVPFGCQRLAHKAKANQTGSLGWVPVYCVYNYIASNLQLKYQK